ncbi:hypothetical protein PV325_002841 [Microctonus aethiopoides]|nr:hypothetical protein PV325_002841 [Microctonus aethiopoides]
MPFEFCFSDEPIGQNPETVNKLFFFTGVLKLKVVCFHSSPKENSKKWSKNGPSHGRTPLKWHTRVKRHISDFKIPAQVWHWQDGSNDPKSLQGPYMKLETSYLQPVVCEPALLHIALREIFYFPVLAHIPSNFGLHQPGLGSNPAKFWTISA